MVTNEEIHKQMEELEVEIEKVSKQMDKALNSKLNKAYNWLVKTFSILVLFASVYTAVLGFAGSAAVLALLFLLTWFMYLLGQFGVGVAKGLLESKVEQAKIKSKYGLLR